MTIRKYSSRAQQTTLSSPITSTATTMSVVNGSSLMGGKTLTGTQTYTVVIDPDTALEEIVDVTVYTTGNTLTISRGIDGPTPGTGSAHSAGAVVRHMAIGRDYQEANDHHEASTGVHGITGAVLGTTDTQTITNKTIAAGSNTISGITSAMITDGTLVNADINASAAIAYSKLALTGAIVSADIANDTIINADINTAAGIDWTKLAISSTVSSAEIGYVDGVTSAIQTQLDSKLATATASSTYAPLASPALTGTPTAPTATAGTNTTQVATTAFVGTAVTNLVGGAPGALDTLNELATALGNDANYSTTITTALAGKLPLAGGTMTGAIAMGTNKITGMGTPTVSTDAATKGYVDTVTVAPSNLTGPITSVGAATAIASQTGTGTKFVVDTSPTLVTPVLGVATATSINGTTIPSTKTLVVTTDKLSVHAATTSAELAGVISDETGSGSLVFATSPTLATPVLGVATATSINGTTIPSTKTLVVTTDKLSVHAATTSAELAGVISDETGSGSLVFGTSPALVSPTVATGADATVGIIVTGNSATQSANLQEWKNSAGTVQASVSNAGALTVGTITSGSINAFSVGGSIYGSYSGTATYNYSTGPTLSGSTKTVNLGTTGVSGSTTNINIGSAVSGATSTINLNGTIANPKISNTYSAKTAAYTFASGDEGNIFSMNNAATQQFNIPTDATFNFAVGTEFTVFWITGAGQPTIGAATPGTTTVISTGATSATPKLRVANSGATCKKLAANSWIVFGDLA